MRAKMRITALALAFAVWSLAIAPWASANHICYPNECRRGDAELNAIRTEPTFERGEWNVVAIDGTNNGRDSLVQTKLRMKGSPPRSKVKPRRSRMFIGADDSYTVFFGAKRRGRQARLTGCTRALPKDLNPTNNCAQTLVPVT